MTLGAGAATAVVGVVAVLVVGWGAWFSGVAARRGPGWARDHLSSGRYAPWLLGLAGAGLLLAVDPVWVGLGVLYIAAVAGFLMRQVRRRLETVEQAYGPFDEDLPARADPRGISPYLVGGGVILAILGVADLAVRGWAGGFALVLAAVLVVAGLFLRR